LDFRGAAKPKHPEEKLIKFCDATADSTQLAFLSSQRVLLFRFPNAAFPEVNLDGKYFLFRALGAEKL
jgi:hypothetical protein